MRVIEIVKERLEAEGFSGLVAPCGDCGCEVADLAPCNSDFSQCEPGYKHTAPQGSTIFSGEDWAIWKQKEPPTDEQWATVSY